MKKTNEPIELNDNEIEKVNGGIKLFILEIPKLFKPILRLIYNSKQIEIEEKNPDTVIDGPIYANPDNDTTIE